MFEFFLGFFCALLLVFVCKANSKAITAFLLSKAMEKFGKSLTKYKEPLFKKLNQDANKAGPYNFKAINYLFLFNY